MFLDILHKNSGWIFWNRKVKASFIININDQIDSPTDLF